MGPAPTYQRILAKVTLEYPDLWRQPVALYFNDADTMVLIPAGDFETSDEDANESKKPVITVYLDAFYIDKYEVTVGQYKQFVQATGHPAPDWDGVSQYSPTDQHPIVAVITHGIIKKSRAVPEDEIQRALRKKRDFEQDPVTHTQEIQ